MNALELAPVTHRIPAFIVAAPGGHIVGRVATFRYDAADPYWTRVTVGGSKLFVSRFGLHQGLIGDHLEPSGLISILPRTGNGVDWVHIDIDRPGQPTATVAVRAENLAEFIGETLFAVPPGFEDDFHGLCDDETFDAWRLSLAGAA